MKNKYFLSLVFNFVLLSVIAQVGVNTTTPEGALDVVSSTNGFVPPRVALTSILVQAPVVNPQTGNIPSGTIVWNTATAGTSPNNVAPGLYYWDGSKWVAFAGSPGGLDWSLTGNSGTTTGNNYIGTNDAVGLVVRTNTSNRFIFANSGRLRSYANGTAATPMYSWNADQNLGMYRIGADNLGFSTAGTERMEITSTGIVNVNGATDVRGYLVARNTNSGSDDTAIIGINSQGGYGVWGRAALGGRGVYGYNVGGTGEGVYGYNNNAGIGTYGRNDGTGIGVKGEFTGASGNGTGVYGVTSRNASDGVKGENTSGSGTTSGVYGVTNSATGYGVLGENTAYAAGGSNEYGVFSIGDSGATGAKTFRIDHPLDPENKYLNHFSIESNEVLNVYRGVTEFDKNGNAQVKLPDYYDSINKDASYQLTPIGAAMSLYISKEIEKNTFTISGGVYGKKVSWQVTANRNDLYMRSNTRKAEVEKGKTEKGKYITPELYNQPKEKGIFYKKK